MVIMLRVFDRARILLENISEHPENVEKLVELASQSQENNETIVKCAIHFEHMGDPEKYESTKKLILKLEELEYSNPELRWDQSIANTLTGPLSGNYVARNNENHDEMHEWRALVTEEILEELAEKRGVINIIHPLLAALNDPEKRDVIDVFLDKIKDKRMGKAGPQTMKKLSLLWTALISNKNDHRYAHEFFAKIIEENQNDLIYFVGPLIAATQTDYQRKSAEYLLNSIKGKNLGKADSETLKELVAICSAVLSVSERKVYPIIVLKKIIEENQNDLIYLAGPLIGALKNQYDDSAPLLDIIKDKKLGNADPETLKKTVKICTAAFKIDSHRHYAEIVLGKIIEENRNDLIYLAGPILAATQDTRNRSVGKNILDKMMDKNLGRGDEESLIVLAKVSMAALRDAFSGKYVEMILKKIIEENQNDMMHLAGPLVAAISDDSCSDSVLSLLDKLKDQSMGTAPPEVLKQFARIATAAFEDNRKYVYIKILFEKIIDEGKTDLIYFVAPLIGSLGDSNSKRSNLSKVLLERMKDAPLGNCDPGEMNELIRIGTASLKNDVQRPYAEHFLGRIIDEEKDNLIYFVGPLIAAQRDYKQSDITSHLLVKLRDKKLGSADPEALKKLARICTAAMHSNMDNVYHFTTKIINEGKNELIWFVAPFFGALRSDKYGHIVEDLLDSMKDRKLGTPDWETKEAIERIFSRAVHNPNERELVLEFVDKLKNEGTTMNINKRYNGPGWNGNQKYNPTFRKIRRKIR